MSFILLQEPWDTTIDFFLLIVQMNSHHQYSFMLFDPHQPIKRRIKDKFRREKRNKTRVSVLCLWPQCQIQNSFGGFPKQISVERSVRTNVICRNNQMLNQKCAPADNALVELIITRRSHYPQRNHNWTLSNALENGYHTVSYYSPSHARSHCKRINCSGA